MSILKGKQPVVPTRTAPPQVFKKLDSVLVRYRDDPRLWHKRVILAFQGYSRKGWPVYTTLTPDRDICDEEFGDSETPIVVFNEGGNPPGFIKVKDIYDDFVSGSGVFTQKELVKIANKYDGCYADGSPLPPVKDLPPTQRGGRGGSDPDEMEVLKAEIVDKDMQIAFLEDKVRAFENAAGRDDRQAHTPPKHRPSPDGDSWVVASPGLLKDAGLQVGDTVYLPDTSTQLKDVAYRWCTGSAVFPEVYIKLSQNEAAKFRKEYQSLVAGEFDGMVPAKTGGGASQFKESFDDEPRDDSRPQALRDVRIIAVAYDSGEGRWRTLADSSGLQTEVDFADWPLEGVRSMKTILTALRRNGKTWMTSHSDWVKNSGVRSNDRAVHEHKSLSKILELLTCYDQLQIVNISGAEAALKRRMLIERAYDGRPDAPVWTGSDHFLGYRDLENGVYVDPEVTKFVSNKLKDEAAVLKEARLKREEDGARKAANAAAGGARKD